MNANIKFGEIMSICSQDIEWKQKSDTNHGPNSVTNLRKMMCDSPKLDLVSTISMHIQNLVKFYHSVLKVLSGNEILYQVQTSNKDHNSITNA